LNQTFKELHAENQKFQAKEFDGCTFIDCHFSDAEFIKCKFTDCLFKNCNLSLVKVSQSAFFDVVFEACKVIGINWTMASWPTIKLSSPLKFYQSILNDCTFLGLSLREIVISECKAHDVDFREADCSEADFSFTELTHSLFNKTNLSYANFSDAQNYAINVFLNEIKGAKFTLPEAVNLLRCLEIEIID
jgi:uncharacterized protein YjbI with pentapeptide repeats